jgi:hypothetical protein
VRRLLIGLLPPTAAGCSEPPHKESDQAPAAIEAARAAGAATTPRKARASVDERDGRQAPRYAVDARQREAEAAGTPAQELRAPQGTLAHARASLQEARSLPDGRNVAAAAAKLAEVREKLDLAATSVSSIPQHAKAGRRKD